MGVLLDYGGTEPLCQSESYVHIVNHLSGGRLAQPGLSLVSDPVCDIHRQHLKVHLLRSFNSIRHRGQFAAKCEVVRMKFNMFKV